MELQWIDKPEPKITSFLTLKVKHWVFVNKKKEEEKEN